LSNSDTVSQEIGRSKIAPSSLRPTRVRWRIVAIIALIMGVTALCRLNLSIAGKYIQDEFAFSIETMGWIFSSFLLGYALFQIPWGYWADRYGPRVVLMASIFTWSLFSAAMGVAPWLARSGWISVAWWFSIIRFLAGVGEAAVSSSGTRVIAFWLSKRERGLGAGLQIGGLGAGGALTPIFIAWSMVRWGWRTSFSLSGIAGFLTLFIWWLYGTERPEQHSRVNATELELIHPEAEAEAYARQKKFAGPPWGKMLSSLSVWGLILGYGCQGYALYVYYNWFYFYVVKVRGLSLIQGAAWMSTPFLAIALLSPLGGWLSDRFIARFGKRRGRQLAGWLGMWLSAAFLCIGTHTADTSVALPEIAAAAGFNMFGAAVFWVACIDLSPDYSASLSSMMNMGGNLGGWTSSIVTGYVAARIGWTQALDLATLSSVCSGLIWFMINAGQSLDEKPA
jgi:ACS family glucarate transporter-like MFS transporter